MKAGADIAYSTKIVSLEKKRNHMHRSFGFLQAAGRIKNVHPSGARWVGTMTPKKQANDDAGEVHVEKGKADPIVAFRRPPPIPPFLGPLVALSMLDAWLKRDNNDD